MCARNACGERVDAAAEREWKRAGGDEATHDCGSVDVTCVVVVHNGSFAVAVIVAAAGAWGRLGNGSAI